jgi:hypothetical protein
VRAENLLVHARQKIRLKTADGLRRARNRLADFIRIKPYQRAVAFLNLDDAILDGHGADCIAVEKTLNAVSMRQLRQRAQRVGHKFFERVVSHSEPIPSASFVVIVQ